MQRTFAEKENGQEVQIQEVATHYDPLSNTQDSSGIYEVLMKSGSLGIPVDATTCSILQLSA